MSDVDEGQRGTAELPDNSWWIAAVTPDGAHLWHVGYTDADTPDEVNALMTAVQAELGFPADWYALGAEWDLSIAPGRPEKRFFVADETTGELRPKNAVTLHEGRPGRPAA